MMCEGGTGDDKLFGGQGDDVLKVEPEMMNYGEEPEMMS